MSYNKKLIEVALPLDAINAESAREKSIRHGHPSTLHLWWARRPLAACRAVLFAQMVDDPSAHPDKFPTDEAQQQERERLFRIIEELVKWENINNEPVLEAARHEIRASAPPGGPPPVLDPFAGGGSIPLEAQRLGLEAHAGDLNPVAVLINKALIEIPPKFAGRPPVNPESRKQEIGNSGEPAAAASHDTESRNKEIGNSHALSRADRMEEGDGGGEGGLSVGAIASAGGDVRDALPDHTGGGLDSGEYRRGLGEGIEQGESAVSGDRSGVASRGGDVSDALRGDRLVSEYRDELPANAPQRGRKDADDAASQLPRDTLTPISYTLFPISYRGAQGLAEDVRYYGQWMRDEAEQRIGRLYPKVKLPKEQGGGEATVIAWLWARTVTCPNPACGAQMPLVRSFDLSTKTGKRAWVEPVVGRGDGRPVVRYEVHTGKGKGREGTVNRRGAKCLFCGTPVPFSYLRDEGKAGRLDSRLMAIVGAGKSGRVYVPPSEEQETLARSATGGWKPEGIISHWPGRTNVVEYGMTTFGDLFTDRQLVALTTFSDLVQEARPRVEHDALAAGLDAPRAAAYADAVATYLGLAVSRLSDISNALCRWENTRTQVRNLFTRQAIPMLWDFAEPNAFGGAAGDYTITLGSITNVISRLPTNAKANAKQQDAASGNLPDNIVVSTDPPYYDNIGYADLSDFFYVWMRRTLGALYPELFSTLLVPKSEELIANPYRFNGSKAQAQEFFEDGLFRTFGNILHASDPHYPLTVYYAFKQAEDSDEGLVSTGWETMLDGLVRTGFQITGTWPLRTELSNRMLASGANALASSVVLACRRRPKDAGMITRRDFITSLKRELPAALRTLQRGNIAPVDLAQASIGPGMAIFSRYAQVVEADGSPMSVRTALALINQALDEFLAEQEGEYDGDTRWALAWFEQNAFDDAPFGDAETLSKAKNTSVGGMVEAGFLHARAGKVRLLRREELDEEWTPAGDKRRTVWEDVQQLIRALDARGEDAAAGILAQLTGAEAESARDLAYRLYTLCERKGWAQEAIAYNGLVVTWPELQRRAHDLAASAPQQDRLL